MYGAIASSAVSRESDVIEYDVCRPGTGVETCALVALALVGRVRDAGLKVVRRPTCRAPRHFTTDTERAGLAEFVEASSRLACWRANPSRFGRTGDRRATAPRIRIFSR